MNGNQEMKDGSILSKSMMMNGMYIYEYEYDGCSGGCKGCGREEIERGCNGEGRIQGGIATVPGFGWWPIKAYRPCPAYLQSGGRYRRTGQSMDQVVSGRPSSSSSRYSFFHSFFTNITYIFMTQNLCF